MSFAARQQTLVIALDYAKAPGSRFPRHGQDIEALLLACLADPTLPIDKSRVALGGWSAGGTLALTVSARPLVRALNPPLRAVVPMYPAVDYTSRAASKAALGGGRRRKTGLIKGFRGRERDYFVRLQPALNWAYLPVGTNLADPGVSPMWLERSELPRHVFVMACELDILANEAWRLAWRLAEKRGEGRDPPRVGEAPGREEVGQPGELVLQGDERFACEEKNAAGSVRWLLVPDVVHSFDQDDFLKITRDKVMAKDAIEKRTKVIDEVGRWLFEAPFQEG